MHPQNNAKPPMSLESLPDELLQPILETLCPHCYATRDYQHKRAREEGLESLTLTSKRLRSIALPIMLHIPENHMSNEGLHKLLDIDPSLGEYIREWELPGYEWDEEVLDPTVETTRKLLATVGQDFDLVQAQNEGLSLEHSLIAELFMARAPKIEKLILERFDYNDWPKADLKYLARRLGKLGDGTGFENVRHLSVTRPCRTTTSLTDGHIMALLRVMPKLEQLNLDSILGLPECNRFDINPVKPALRNLTTLRLQWCVFEGTAPNSHYSALCEMLKHAPNLKTFAFLSSSSSGAPGFVDHDVSIKDFLLALQPVANHLKHLELDFSTVWCATEGIKAPMLANFTALESFYVSLEDICQCDPSHENFEDPPVPRCTADIIPPSVKHLNLILKMSDTTGCSRCILGIGKKVAEGGLENLETVKIVYAGWRPRSVDEPYNSDRYDEAVQSLQDWHEAFKESRVPLRFKGDIYRWMRYHKGDELAWMEGTIEKDGYDW
ncbi:uncharacterized protein NECHADRAFT_87647 [Fusarium vanettenii 77-13-4]|uniref:F-box domain-containing protein n=1 Tax=Fusarium vanettenii (strain ATCC MYA-4622 / CBS 123669 / FGSC 9596 / NRRL 45880 / 77-13-4) TaxID=660122 RepID=C7Z2M0_FUSV7|nr:uncharacterized protein NECHADRAFT_87647 [Fusarium vanettenii 77-13-4]EEU41688.1 predicted protein [Fusarium vanettenii 77-13-4]